MKYRNKKTGEEVEAWQSFADAGTHTMEWPQWVIVACTTGMIFSHGKETRLNMEGATVRIDDGDWIIRDKEGELRYCSGADFPSTYDLVNAIIPIATGTFEDLRKERDDAIKEAARRDQKWMDGIDQICGVKLEYSDPSSGKGLESFILHLRNERDAAVGHLKHISETLCGVKVEGDITLDMVYCFVEGQIDKQHEYYESTRDKLRLIRDGIAFEFGECVVTADDNVHTCAYCHAQLDNFQKHEPKCIISRLDELQSIEIMDDELSYIYKSANPKQGVKFLNRLRELVGLRLKRAVSDFDLLKAKRNEQLLAAEFALS